jgi:hypothetical protein
MSWQMVNGSLGEQLDSSAIRSQQALLTVSSQPVQLSFENIYIYNRKMRIALYLLANYHIYFNDLAFPSIHDLIQWFESQHRGRGEQRGRDLVELVALDGGYGKSFNIFSNYFMTMRWGCGIGRIRSRDGRHEAV